ncbi:ankyrin repeat-containing domain protein [Aspergillus carlsbadensis]|nr:ankyrin repeat-containing domain protein [Aspergillus carlsbadensis]
MEEDDFVVVDTSEVPSSMEISPVLAESTEWLEPTAYTGESSELQQHLNWLVPGTGEWIEQTTEFRQWQSSSSHGALWIKAIAGAGKSVLVARLVSLLQQQCKAQGIPVLFFFFRQIVVANHGPNSLVRDWLAQLLGYSPSLQKTLKDLRSRTSRVQDVAFNELWHVLLDTLGSLKKVYCVVDALDELDTNHTADFLPRLVALGQLAPDRVKLIMSSRPLPHIQKVLNDPSVLEIRLENTQVNKDIAIFVDYRLRQAQPNLSERVLLKIKQAVGNRVHPSFLYARLLLNELLEKHSAEDWSDDSVRQSLVSIPTSLEDLYTHMLAEHSRKASVPQDRQVLILKLVTHATRPLRLLEIATVLDFLSMGSGPDDAYPDTKAMTRMSCGPLLEILEDETVAIIHHSLTEFLTDQTRTGTGPEVFPVIDSQETHQLMAEICLKYLSAAELPKGDTAESESPKDLKRAQMKHPFTDYAARTWFDHTGRLPELGEDFLAHLAHFMGPDNSTFSAWIRTVMKLKDFEVPTVTPLHAAAWAGMANYVETLLATGLDPNVSTVLETAPLGMAAQNGHADVVKALLQHGAAPDEPDFYGMKPLHYAARANHHRVVQALMGVNVSPTTPKTRDPTPRKCGNAPTSVGHTPLQYACCAGAIESVRAMMPHFTEKDAWHAIDHSIASSRNQLVELVVTFPGLPFDSEWGGSALLRAIEKVNFPIIQLLLKMGCDPKWKPKQSNVIYISRRWEPAKSALLALAKSRGRFDTPNAASNDAIERCLDLILSAGYTADGRELREFVKNGLPGVEKLLQHGASVEPDSPGENTPLHHYRPQKSSQHILDALMRHGARWTVARRSDGKTPLHTCLEDHYSFDLGVLAPYITDWNIPDAKGNTPLHLLRMRSERTVKMLVDLGADPNRRNHAGQTPLHLCRSTSDIQAFVAAGADLEARDAKGRTILLISVRDGYGDEQRVKHLLAHGANVHAVDFEGNGVLSHAVRSKGGGRVWEYLLSAGADPLQTNYRGDTLYHMFMEGSSTTYRHNSDKRILEWLLQHEALGPTAQNHAGQTILHLRCRQQPPLYGTSKGLHEENFIERLPSGTIDALLEIPDNEGRRPIHDAVATSEYLVAWLIDKGATLTALTHSQQSTLHIAAISKQSNTMGFLLETVADSQREHLVNQQDDEGRTPLFYACLSGHLETVSLLLAAGADIQMSDSKGATPLHACAYFKDDRPMPARNRHESPAAAVHQPRETFGVSGVIAILRTGGASLVARDNQGRTPLALAVEHGNEVMVAAMLEDTEREMLESATQRSHQPIARTSPEALVLAARHASEVSAIDILADSSDDDAIPIYRRLMKLGAHQAIEGLARRGLSLIKKGEDSRYPRPPEDFLHDIVNWGHCNLFETLGRMRGDSKWIDGVPGKPRDSKTVEPFLLSAVRRKTPSMDLLKVIVETFHADVNIQTLREEYYKRENRIMSSATAIGVLAEGDHWWHTEGVRYLLQHGANPDLADGKGQSPLHIALNGGYRRSQMVKILLEGGANPNLVDDEGNTPLGLAAGNTELVRLLLKHGADIHQGSNPILFSAITKQDVDTVRVILDAGIDCNKPFTDPQPEAEQTEPEELSVRDQVYGETRFHGFWFAGEQKRKDKELLLCRPLHYACRAQFAAAERKDKAHEIVKLLLDHGASPFLHADPGDAKDVIIHDIIHQRGIFEPLLQHPDLDLEQRDGSGRTLFLAACSEWTLEWFNERRTRLGQPEVIRQLCDRGADMTVTDNSGNNAIHLLLKASHEEQEYSNTNIEAWSEPISFVLDRAPDLIRQQNHEGYTPFHTAAAKHLFPLINLLIKRGSNAIEPDPQGNTILHHLAVYMYGNERSPSLPQMATFVSRGLDINARNNDGETPILKYISCARSDHGIFQRLSVIEQLIEMGADISTQNNAGETILHIIAGASLAESDEFYEYNPRFENIKEDEKEGAFKYFMAKGLDPFKEDNRQQTAVDVAAAYGKDGVLALFQKGKEKTWSVDRE